MGIIATGKSAWYVTQTAKHAMALENQDV